MTLILEGNKEANKVIRLERTDDGVEVWIDNDYIARFDDDGEFILHGIHGKYMHKDRWDKE